MLGYLVGYLLDCLIDENLQYVHFRSQEIIIRNFSRTVKFLNTILLIHSQNSLPIAKE